MRKYLWIACALVAMLAVSCTEKDPKGGEEQKQIEQTTLEVAPAVIRIAGEEGSVATAVITSNSDELSAEVKDAAKAWLSVSVAGTTLTVTAKTTNTDIEDRNGVVIVYAGEGVATVNTEIVVCQEPGAPAAAPEVSVDKNAVGLGSDEGSVAQVIVTTNVTEIAASCPEADTWLKVEVLNNTVTIRALSDNTGGAERASTVTITVSGNNQTASTTVVVTQAVKEANPDGPWQIGSSYQGGVLYWISEDGKTGKVLYPKAASNISFATEKSAETTPEVKDKDDGRINMAAMKAIDPTLEKFPAAKYCDDLEGDWYLPGINELVTLAEAYNGTTYDARTQQPPVNITAEEKAARKAFDGFILACDPNGVLLNNMGESENGDGIWGSDCTSVNNASYFRFGKLAKMDASKTYMSNKYARCIKIVSAPDAL